MERRVLGVPGDLLTIEDKIYGKLAEVLETNTPSGDFASGAAHPTDSADAYDSSAGPQRSARP